MLSQLVQRIQKDVASARAALAQRPQLGGRLSQISHRPGRPGRRESVALGTVLTGLVALVGVSCAPGQTFSPRLPLTGTLLAPRAGSVPASLNPNVSAQPALSGKARVEATGTAVPTAVPSAQPSAQQGAQQAAQPGEAKAQPVAVADAVAVAPPAAPVVEVAQPLPGGTPFIPEVERWRGMVREMIAEARAEGRLTGAGIVLDEDLVLAVIEQESGGDPNAESWAGALGLMQLMPPSFAWIMGIRNWGEDVSDIDPVFILDPQTNLRAGVRFLGAVLEEQGGSVYWALASYNAGGGAVNAWRAAGLTSVPAIGGYVETANYAPAILANYSAHRP